MELFLYKISYSLPFISRQRVNFALSCYEYFLHVDYTVSYFLIDIHSLTSLPKKQIYLWNHSETSLFTSFSNLAASSFLFQISYSSTTLFTSIDLFIFYFFVIFLFLFFFHCSTSSLFFHTSFLNSSFLCFYHSNFPWTTLYYFLHFIGHLIIFTTLSSNQSQSCSRWSIAYSVLYSIFIL